MNGREPRDAAAVVARLDELGWTVEHTTLLDRTGRHVLALYNDRRNPVRWVIVNLVDGHTVATYGTEQAARTAFDLLARRDREGGQP